MHHRESVYGLPRVLIILNRQWKEGSVVEDQGENAEVRSNIYADMRKYAYYINIYTNIYIYIHTYRSYIYTYTNMYTYICIYYTYI